MSEYIVCDTRSGAKTLIKKIDGSDRDIKLHSAYDPIKEAERTVESFDKGKSSVIAISGIALGYHIQLIRRKYPDVRILAIENDSSVTEICSKLNPEFLTGITVIHSEHDLGAFFETISLSDFRGISHYMHRPSYQINPAFYENILNNMKLYISSKVSDLLTRFEFEEKWIKNIFENLTWLDRTPGVSEFFDKFRGYPGIIVSAGPSLKSDLEELRRLGDSAVVVCVDTAIKVLSRAGIEPHFIMTLDAQKHSFKHFTGIRPGKSVLVADMVSCPAILNYYTGRKTISTTAKYYQDAEGRTVRETTPVMDWIEEFFKTPGDIQSGGSVATSAFDLLLNMGCDPIILLGQDLSYTGREIHCSGTHHNDDWLSHTTRLKNLDSINQNVIRKRKIKYVTRFRGNGRVISDFVFDLYKSWFEDSASKVKIKVINSNSGGARINNTMELYASDLDLTGSSRVNPQEVIDGIFSRAGFRNLDKIIKKLAEVYKRINTIIDITESGIPDKEKYAKLDQLLGDRDLNALLKPLMRKSEFYTSRHTLDNDRVEEMMYNEVRLSSIKLKSFIRKYGDFES